MVNKIKDLLNALFKVRFTPFVLDAAVPFEGAYSGTTTGTYADPDGSDNT